MKKLFVGFVGLCLVGMMAFSAIGAEKKPLDQVTIGYVMPYNIGWFAYFGDAFDMIAKSYGIKTVRMLSQWQPDQEAKAVQDLIAMKVDAINVCSGSPDSAQYVSQLANDAGIPLSIEDSAIAPGPGKPIADIEFNWYRVGEMLAEEISARWPNSKIVFIQGRAGVGPVESQNQGIQKKAKELGNIEVVSIQYGDYMIEKALSITKDLVQSGLKFDVIIGGCQELTEGIIEGLKSEGVKDKIVLTVNGGPMDVVNFQEKELHGGVSQSPGFHALLCALTLIEYLKGNPVPATVNTPVLWVTPEDYQQKLLPWQMDEKWIPIAEKFIRTGKLEY